jgi:O-antigen ligase
MIQFKHLIYLLVALTWFEGATFREHRIIILYGLLLGGLWLLFNLKKIITLEISFTEKGFYLIGVLLLFWTWEALSLIWANEITPVSEERIFNVIAAVGFTVLLLDQLKTDRDWINTYKILAITGTTSSLLVLYEAYTGTIHRPTGYISPDPNYTAMHITILLPLLYYLAKDLKYPLKIPLIGGIIITALATVSTGSRAGIISLMMIALIIFYQELKEKDIKTIALTFLALLTVFSIAASISPELLSPGFKRFESLIDIAKGETKPDFSVSNRYSLIIAGTKMIADNPILGVGTGNFRNRSPEYGALRPNEAHNTYIEVAGELGIIGIAIFLGLIYFAIKNFQSLEKNKYTTGAKISFIAVLINFLFLTAFTDRRFYLLIALTVGMSHEKPLTLREFLQSAKEKIRL